MHRSPSRRAALASSCFIAACAGLLGAVPAHADGAANGTLFVTSSRYSGGPSTVTVGQPLPITPSVAAIADGSYPGVFANDTVDGNFGITAPILLNAYKVWPGRGRAVEAWPLLPELDITAWAKVSTSFPSKSELALNPSTDGRALTLMGYVAAPNTLDVSNSNTPGNIDPTNNDTQAPTYRAVVQINLDDGRPRSVSVTPVNAYSGNNGRAAVLASHVNGSGTSEYLMVGNAGNGSGIEPTNIVNDTGVQSIAPGSTTAISTVIGAPQGTPGSKNGFQYGFSVAQIGDAADKSGKDDNFRGLTVFGNTLYVSKGSGGKGIKTVYQVVPAGGGLPMAATGATTRISILPGFPTTLDGDVTVATQFYPFGIWFANATTLYVADEGSQDLNADPNAGLQKWIFDGTRWNLAYTIQAGLDLDTPYQVANYPAQYAPATTGLRNLTGVVDGGKVTLFATTATFSNLGDPGADPNMVVRVVDDLKATTPPRDEAFRVVKHAAAFHVYRGVAYVSGERRDRHVGDGR